MQFESLRVAPSGSNANVIRLEPPVCITFQEIDGLIASLQKVCDMLRRRDAFPLAAGVCADSIAQVPAREVSFTETESLPKPILVRASFPPPPLLLLTHVRV